MTEEERKRASLKLAKAVMTPVDELAAKVGEGNLLVKIKRNTEKLDKCSWHIFEPQPGWRDKKGPFTWQKVKCKDCGGELDTRDAMMYLRGLAHGSGRNYDEMANEVWPP